MGVTRPARRARINRAAWGLTTLTVAVLAAALVFAALNSGRTGMARVGLEAILSAAVLLYAASGRLITSRQPDNAIGWLLGSIGLAVATSLFAEQYALYGVATAPGAVPAAKAVGSLAPVGAFATVLLMFIIVLLFPDGHLPSPRWRPVLWATVVVFTGWGTQQFQLGTTVTGGLTNAPGPFGRRRAGTRPRLDLAGRTLTAGLTTVSTQRWISGSPLPGRCRSARRPVAFRS